MTVTRMIAGRYRLDAEIGRGTTGTVFNAYDDVLHRRVAIKEVTLPSGMPRAEAEQLTERTLREARAIAALTHPHVITLYDIVMLATGPVIVMELMAARSLAEILADHGPLPVSDAAIVGQAIASGLLAAHAAHITHRDIKPANVLIGDDGRIKLTDFGIARSVRESSMTAAGLLLGSPAYISPEVASGQPARPSADAWGLGATLFAAVEGRPPFDRGEAIATLTAVVHDPVPGHDHAGELGPIIDALLVKDPAQRLDVAEARRRLAALAAGAQLTIAPTDSDLTHSVTTDDAALGSTTTDSSAADSADNTARHRPAHDTSPAMGPHSALPPPPWGTDGAGLAALPHTAPPTARPAVLIAAVIVALLAAGFGIAEVLVLAQWG